MSFSYIHFETDINCKVYKFGAYLCDVYVGKDCCEPFRKGSYKLRFESIENPLDFYEIIYNIDEIDIETFYTISITPIREKRLLEEQKLRKAAWEEEERLRLLKIKREKDNLDKLRNQFVDLGLSVKWATCNLGAKDPHESGNFYAWGETKNRTTAPRDSYSHYRYIPLPSKDDSPYLHPFSANRYGNDGLTQLKSYDDAATNMLGAGYRIPTSSEFKELYFLCTWTRKTMYGVEGYVIRSKVKGYTDQSIFLPIVGYFTDKGFQTESSSYWTSNLGEPIGGKVRFGLNNGSSIVNYMWAESFTLKSSGKFMEDFSEKGMLAMRNYISTNYRICLLPIRPVCDK